LAVFLDGCFWHGCPEHGTSPKANTQWWQEKLAANRSRDDDTNRHLSSLGWYVLRFWEHDAVDLIVEEIGRKVNELRTSLR
jgi:DNA mismatch endonuclease (patch repair protein)